MPNSQDGETFETRPLPKTFVLELTRHCNHHCLYCYAPWNAPGLGYDSHVPHEMSVLEIEQVVCKLQNETPVESIALSGGEPLLRNDFPEIITFLNKRGLGSVVITNGTLLTEELVAITAKGCAYEVTLLSFRPEIHNQLASRSGAWDAALNGMANVRQAGGTLVVVFVATCLNYMDLYKTAELAIALGAQGFMYNRLNLGAHNIQYSNRLSPTPAMIRENLDMLEELAAKYNLPVSVSVVIEPCVVDIQNYKHIHFGWCPCAGGDSYFTIDCVGNIRICNHSPTILGNILVDNFSNIYYTHPHVRSYYETLPAECADCPLELKNLCRGGCRAAAEQCYGTLEHVDPFVAINHSPKD